jgi:hypothetical protein
MRVPIAVLLFVIIGCSKSNTFSGGQAPPEAASLSTIDADQVESIEVTNQPGIAEPSLPVRSTDLETIRDFLASIQRAEKTEDHKCPSLLQVMVVSKSEKHLKILLLPGHKDRYYEFREPGVGIYRVPREPFIAALRKLGLKHVPLSPGDVTVSPPPPNQPDDF